MKKIYNTEIIRESDHVNFQRVLNYRIDEWEHQELEVEVQYHPIVTPVGDVWFTALLIARIEK